MEKGDPGDLGLDGLLEGEEVQEAVERDGGGEGGGEGGKVGQGGRGESGLVKGGGPVAPVDGGPHAGGVGEPRGVVVCGEDRDLVLGELLGEGKPPEERADFDGGAGEGDGKDVHICRHVAHGDQQAWGLLRVQGDGQEGPGVSRRQLFALETELRMGVPWCLWRAEQESVRHTACRVVGGPLTAVGRSCGVRWKREGWVGVGGREEGISRGKRSGPGCSGMQSEQCCRQWRKVRMRGGGKLGGQGVGGGRRWAWRAA